MKHAQNGKRAITEPTCGHVAMQVSGLACTGTIRNSASPWDAVAVRRAVVRPGGLWRAVEVTGSTNADLLARAAAGATEGLELAAEKQTADRGPMGRSCVPSPARGANVLRAGSAGAP